MTEPSSATSAGDTDAGRRVALLLEYDGARFAGSQLQPEASTVQGVLEAAIAAVTGVGARAAFAGRTDAGVHAHGQVASLTTTTRLGDATLLRALNARLPADVVVRALMTVTPDFDPRRQARRRHYRYTIANGATRPALDRGRAWFVASPLDVEAMQTAAQTLVGAHDFAAFASPLEDASASTVRELYSFAVSRRGSQVDCDVVGNAFLPHQVRRMVGALVEVGKGRRAASAFASLLEGPAASAGPAAPAHGLCLVAVDYATPLFEECMDSKRSGCSAALHMKAFMDESLRFADWAGRAVDVVIDRPLGSVHPRFADIVYGVNYGYLPDTQAPDGHELDAYVLGAAGPIERCNGRVIAVVRRYDDVEDKLVVALSGDWDAREIAELTQFQERYFDSWIETADGLINVLDSTHDLC